MTLEEMQSQTLKFWRESYPQQLKELDPELAQRESKALAELARMEMDVLNKTYMMTDAESWPEARKIFRKKPPPSPDVFR